MINLNRSTNYVQCNRQIFKSTLYSAISDQNQTESLISETQEENDSKASDLPTIPEKNYKVNKDEKSKPNSVNEYLKLAKKCIASNDKEGAVQAYKSALELKPASLFFKLQNKFQDTMIYNDCVIPCWLESLQSSDRARRFIHLYGAYQRSKSKYYRIIVHLIVTPSFALVHVHYLIMMINNLTNQS